MNSQLSQSLERVLQDQLSLYEKYLELATKDEEYMSKLQIENLEKNNKLKTTVILKLQAMDEARKAALKQMAKDYKIEEKDITLEKLFKSLSQVQAMKLRELRNKLRLVISKAKDIQKNTATLAQASMTWINGSMAALQGLLATAPTYTAQGVVQTNESFSGRQVEKRA